MSAPEQSHPGRFDPDVQQTLDSAEELCRRALADYRAGLLDEDELRVQLFRHGLVQWPDVAWLLDMGAGRWWRYDGVGIGPEAVAGDGPGVARLRSVIDELATKGGGE